jgi:15-cis-phytoene synthase
LVTSFAVHRAIVDHVEPAARFLIEAVAATSPPVAAVPRPRSKSMAESAVWVLDLFERLERRDQLLRGENTS